MLIFLTIVNKRRQNLKELLKKADHYKTVNIVNDEMHRHKRFDSCTNFVVVTEKFTKVRRST